MFTPPSQNPARLQALETIKAWTRERFGLTPAFTIFTAELKCSLPGCPPLETVISFWDERGKRYHFKIFKRAEEIVPEDLPYAWLLDALAVPEDFECQCC